MAKSGAAAASAVDLFAEWNLWAAKVPRDEFILITAVIVGGSIAFALFMGFVVAKPAYRSRVFSFTGLWLVMCSVIHCVIELQFTQFRDKYFAHGVDLYAAGDLRYGRPLESGTASMELITAVITGPLCIASLIGLARNTAWRHIAIITASTCQLYGLVWFIFHPYFSTEKATSDDPFLFWFVVVGFNAPWGLIPPFLWYNSARAIAKAVGAADASSTAASTKAGKKGR